MLAPTFRGVSYPADIPRAFRTGIALLSGPAVVHSIAWPRSVDPPTLRSQIAAPRDVGWSFAVWCGAAPPTDNSGSDGVRTSPRVNIMTNAPAPPLWRASGAAEESQICRHRL